MLKFLCWVRVGEGIIQAVDSRQGGLLGIVRLCPSLPSPLVFSNSDIDVHQYSLHNIWIKGAVSAKLSATGSFITKDSSNRQLMMILADKRLNTKRRECKLWRLSHFVFYYFDIKIGEHYSPHITAGTAASQTRLQSPTQTPSNHLPNLTKSQTRAGHHTDLISD